MGGEILSQAEIDALLNIYAQEGGDLTPGEREALERVADLVAEALKLAWGGLGMWVAVERTGVTAGPSQGESPVAGPALVLPVRMEGAARGELELWVEGGALEGVAGHALGMWSGAESVTPEEVTQLARVAGSFAGPLAGGLGSLLGKPVALTAGEPAVAQPPDLAQRLGRHESWARLDLRVRIGESEGGAHVFWPLEEARQFLSLIGGEEAAEAPAAEEAEEVAFEPVEAQAASRPPVGIDLLLDVPLTVTVELGRAERAIKDILSLAPGSVVELDRLAGEAVDVTVNGRLIARGEVVVVDDRFGVRITDIVSRAERLRRLG